MYVPCKKTVYDLKEKSGNAKRIQRWREKNMAVATEMILPGILPLREETEGVDFLAILDTVEPAWLTICCVGFRQK